MSKKLRKTLIILGLILASALTYKTESMAEPVWGLLPKAQDNAQTIDEAIASAISTHEADSEAHTGTGESLETHKSQEIIDHPAGSVLVDKHTNTEWLLDTTFQSLTNWSTTGDINIADLTGITMYVEWGATDTSRIYSVANFISNFFDKDFNMMYQVMFRWDGTNSHINAWFGFFDTYDTSADGFGFQIRDGALYATVGCGGSLLDEEIAGIDIAEAHIYRAQYNAEANEVEFFIDGTLMETITRPTGSSWADDRGPEAGATLTESNDGNFHVANLLVGRSLI